MINREGAGDSVTFHSFVYRCSNYNDKSSSFISILWLLLMILAEMLHVCYYGQLVIEEERQMAR